MSLRRSSDERAESEQAEGRRAWVDGVFFVIMSDADEPEDLVERAGTGRVAVVGIFSTNEQPKECLKGTCWRPSDACDTCIHGSAKPEKVRARQPNMEDVRVLLKKYGDYAWEPYPPLNPVFQSRHEMEIEAYLTAPLARGKHALVEPQAWRMGL